MLLRSLKAIVHAQAKRSATDAVLGGLGVSTAVASACFAGYMALTDTGDLAARGQGQFAAFLLPDYRAAQAMQAQVHQAPAPEATDGPGVDFMPTGSVSSQQFDPADGQGASDDARVSTQDFAVRDVFDGTAMIEAHGTLQLVKPGTVLEGVGRVLDIRRSGNAWVVVTESGNINQRR